MDYQDYQDYLKFSSPSAIGVMGSSQSGKSYFTAKLLKYSEHFFTIPPTHIFYCFQQEQDLFEELERALKNKITFNKGLPTEDQLSELTANKTHVILVLDDLMMESQSSKFIEKIFCVYSHHKMLTVLTLQQNIFYQGKSSRTISLQLHYFVLFQNNRDKSQIMTLAKQIAPGKTSAFLEIYNDCMSKPYSYLIIDIAPNSNQQYKFRTNIFAQLEGVDSFPIIYRMV